MLLRVLFEFVGWTSGTVLVYTAGLLCVKLGLVIDATQVNSIVNHVYRICSL